MVRIKRLISIGTMFVCGAAMPAVAGDTENKAAIHVPTPDLVTMVDLGTHKCIHFKMMAPIIEKLKKGIYVQDKK